jgi:hypothetical protein
MNPSAEPLTQIPGQAPGNLTYKLTPSIPLSFQREGEAEGGGEFTKVCLLNNQLLGIFFSVYFYGDEIYA